MDSGRGGRQTPPLPRHELPTYGAETQVKVQRAEGWPTKIRVRNANELTLSEAAALMHALELALAEAGVEVTE